MLKIGIVGLPNVGKSTIFKALTSQPVDISNYPFCTINPNIGVVQVFDERLQKLAQIFPKPNIIYPAIEFVDIAGLVKGASKGQGLGNKFLAHIRQVDAILEIVRFFKQENVSHVHGIIDPLTDIKVLETELLLADLEIVIRHLQKLSKQIRTQDKDILKEMEITKKIKLFLDETQMLNQIDWNLEEKRVIENLGLISAKPIFYIYNCTDSIQELNQYFLDKKHLILDLKIEEEIQEMDAVDIKELGLKSGMNNVIKACFELLNLIVFFTMNDNEIRAWEIKKGTKVPQAGRMIHTDFEQKFIRAEVIQWDKLIETGSWRKAKDLGMMQTVGKDYLVQNGDVIYFLI